MRMKQLCAAKQLLGQREKQEDYVEYLLASPTSNDESEALLVLADGMGGYVGGEKASHLVVEKFIESYQQTQTSIVDTLSQALENANHALFEEVATHPQFRGMGSTLIAAHISNMHLHWVSVGDSPFWLFRNEKLLRLNQDHSMAAVYEHMVEIGQMSEEDALNEPMRNSLRSVVKGEEIAIIDLPETTFALQASDILLLASDGLQTLSNTQITDILSKHQHNNDLNVIANELLAAVKAKKQPKQDNVSVIIYKLPDSKSEPRSSSSTPWYLNTITLFIISVFALSSFLVFLLLQFSPHLFENTLSEKQPQTAPTSINHPATDTQTDITLDTPTTTSPSIPSDTIPDATINNTGNTETVAPDSERVLQAPLSPGKPLNTPNNSQIDGDSDSDISTDNIETIDSYDEDAIDRSVLNQPLIIENEKDTIPQKEGADKMENSQEPGAPPRLDSDELQEQPVPEMDNLPPSNLPPEDKPLIVESPLSLSNSAERPPIDVEKTRVFSQ